MNLKYRYEINNKLILIIGVIAGILASFSDGTVTDSSWDCSLNPTPGWKVAGFIPDSSWQAANTFGYGPFIVTHTTEFCIHS